MSRQVQQGIGGILTYVAVGLIVAAQAYQFWIVSTLTTGGLITTTEYGLYQACSVTNIGTVCRFYCKCLNFFAFCFLEVKVILFFYLKQKVYLLKNKTF